jgi:hypothetical protein
MSDREVVDALYAVSKGGCDYDNVMMAYNRVLGECSGDGERLSRLIVQLAQERKECTKWSLRALAAHGTPQSLPFICGFTNDLSCAGRAASAIVHILGVSSNSIDIVDHVMRLELRDEHDKYVLCAAVAQSALREQHHEQRMAIAALKKYSREVPATSLWADEFLLSLDPDYETSEDRRTLLRQVAARRQNDYQVNYATNALNRISARLRTDKAQGLEGKED